MTTLPPFDAALLRGYDRPGPRYTSYPTAPQFGTHFGAEQLREAAERSASNAQRSTLSLYVHVPFCMSPCFYCGCNRAITRDKTRADAYLKRLFLEIELAASLFDGEREVVQLHFGGGTPNFLSVDQLRETVETLKRRFRFGPAERSDISIELDPRFLSPDEVEQLAEIGFNRASLGVQDFDPLVQRSVNRVQGVAETGAIIDACRRGGMRSVNVDLIYGLPNQTTMGFERTLSTVIAMRPDRLAIYGYAHLPSLFKPQRQINEADIPAPELKLGLLRIAIEKLTQAGYVYIGMDHFALPQDELAQAQQQGSLHRNFMGYTTHADSDLLGLGVSAISHIGDSFSQNARDLLSWQQALDENRLPVWRGMRLNQDDIIRSELIQGLMCQGVIDTAHLEAQYRIDFAGYFAQDLEALTPLVQDGLVERSPQRIVVTPRGRYLLRNIAMCFDAYLKQPAAEAPRFSRAI